VIDDTTKAHNQPALDSIIDGMRFGSVGVNVPPSVANAFPVLVWGGFPGHTTRDVQSGIGFLGNFCCYENPEKSIMQNRFENMIQFVQKGTPAYQMKKYRRQSEVFVYMSMLSLVKYVSADSCGI